MSNDVQQGSGADAGAVASQLGSRVAQYRAFRGMSLRTLSQEAGLSSSFLSQLENGHTNASVASLHKIAHALNITVAQLFEVGPVHSAGVLRAADRPSLLLEGGTKFVLSMSPLKNIEIYAGELQPGGTTGLQRYAHGDSQEFFIVVAGNVVFELGEERHDMAKGDSIEFLSSVPHRAENISSVTAEVIWVTSPPHRGEGHRGAAAHKPIDDTLDS